MIRTHFTEEQIQAKRAAIKKAVLGDASEHLTKPDVRIIQKLVEQYDSLFFGGLFRENHINFDIKYSGKMTECGGKLSYATKLKELPSIAYRVDFLEGRDTSFFLTLSSAVIFRNFTKQDSTEKVNGLIATSRFEALSFIVEHELIHAIDVILNGRTGHGANFQRLAKSFFGQTEYCHEIGRTAAAEQTDEELKQKFAACAPKVAVSSDVFGSYFFCKGSAIKIIGINTRRPKFPFVGIDEKGRQWKLTRNQVLSAIKQNKEN